MTKTRSQKMRRRQAVAQKRGQSAPSVRNPPPVSQRAMVRKPTSYQKSPFSQPNVMARRAPVMSSYLRSLQYPETTMGTKCPDPSTFVPTGTMQLIHRFVINSITDGGSPPVYYAGVFMHPKNQANYSVVTGAPKGSGYTTLTTTNSQLPGWTSFVNNYDRYRVVSGCILSEYTGSNFNNQGQACVWADYDGTSPSTWESSVVDSSTILAAAKETLKVCYRPQDNSDYEFISTSSSTENQHYGIYYKGVDASFSAVVTIVLNLEGVPNVESSSIVNVSSPNTSLSQLNQAKNYLGGMLLFGGIVKGGTMAVKSVARQMNDVYSSG